MAEVEGWHGGGADAQVGRVKEQEEEEATTMDVVASVVDEATEEEEDGQRTDYDSEED